MITPVSLRFMYVQRLAGWILIPIIVAAITGIIMQQNAARVDGEWKIMCYLSDSSTDVRTSILSLNVSAMVEALRTLITSAGRKHARQVPPLCRTLG